MRYAIYYAPERHTKLWRFGCRVLGRDAETAEALPPLAPAGIDRSVWSEWTSAPRRYGFHGTLKAPFALKDGVSEADLIAAISTFSAAQEAFDLPPLKVASLGPFVALVPEAPVPDLDRFAAECVTTFDHFRAPLTPEARAKRLASPLSPSERLHLDRWGYPHVFADFRFHMTLTGSLPDDVTSAVSQALHEIFVQEVGEEPVRADSVAIFAEPDAGAAFRLVRRFPLRG